MSTFTLSSGYEMPVIGLGTWQSGPDEVETAVTVALDCGYRHIDTAFFYQNEDAIGRSLKKWVDEGGDREELFITTKLPPMANRASDVEACLDISLEKLGLDYVDMYLIHLPFGFIRDDDFGMTFDDDGLIVLDYDTDHVDTWKAMESLVETGKARSIGLSNFTQDQMLNVIENCEVKPSNLQIEIQAYFQQRPMREFCAKHDIVVTAYSSLASPGANSATKTDTHKSLPDLLQNPVVEAIADVHEKSTAQILLRHQIQGNVIVIPKSTNPERIAQNIDIFDFELTEDEMQQLDELDQDEDGRIFSLPNVFKGVENHPHCPH